MSTKQQGWSLTSAMTTQAGERSSGLHAPRFVAPQRKAAQVIEPDHLRVCFVLAYRAPDYIRGRSICTALRASERVTLFEVKNTDRGLFRYWQTIRALLHARKNHNPDVYLLGFRGHEIAWLVRWLVRGKPLVIDALMSPYASLSEESKLGRLGRVFARIWRPYERAILRASEGVLTDTEGHAHYYRCRFGVPAARILTLPVGAEERLFDGSATARSSAEPLRVLFYGSFLSLHGMDIILAAASRLAGQPIDFRFIGGTHAQATWLERRCDALGITRYTHARWVDFDRIVNDEIPSADLCLGGPFGGTPQALRVVTGKTSQCLALGRPTIVGKIEEDHGFIDQDNCLLVEQGDPDALAAAIGWAQANRDALDGIGERGRLLYEKRLSRAAIRAALVPFLERLVPAYRGPV